MINRRGFFACFAGLGAVSAAIKTAPSRMKQAIEGVRSSMGIFDASLGCRSAKTIAALKFHAGEQWDAAVKAQRELDGRPCLVVNKLPAFVDRIVRERRITSRSQIEAVIVEVVDEHGDQQRLFNYYASSMAEHEARFLKLAQNGDTPSEELTAHYNYIKQIYSEHGALLTLLNG